MLTNWMHWLSSLSWSDLLWMLLGFALLDGPRYVLSTTCVTLFDWAVGIGRWVLRRPEPAEFTHCPSVCAMIVGLNEGDCLSATLESLIGTYPRLEVVVCDDGSSDEMSSVARDFQHQHPEMPMQVITRPWRGGKSSALNWAYSATRAEIIVGVDGDSNLEPDTLWEIVQPFADPGVGLVSGMVRVRNWSRNLCTWCQALEYLQSILVGRRVSALLGILPLSSGALSAVRREVLERLGGWDIGPGEDLDIALRTRKLGYQIAFASYANCQTEAPTKWWVLIKQRFRWDGDSSVRHFIRKHNDLGNFTWANFRVSNFFVLWDAVIFHLVCGIMAIVWVLGELASPSNLPWLFLCLTFYAVSLLAEIPSFVAILFYSRTRRTDAVIALAMPVMPIYRLLFLLVRVYANVCEIFFRSSYQLKHVPPHVREATWRW